MRIDTPPRRDPPESIVPMINVVFLLLIFFLMTAQIAPPEPFEVTPPEASDGAPSEGELTLYLSAGGELAFGDARGDDAALSSLSAACEAAGGCRGPEAAPVTLRADAEVPATRLAQILPQVGALGIGRLELLTVAR